MLRPLLILLLIASAAHSLQDFNVRAYHARLHNENTVEEVETVVLDTLKSLLGDKIQTISIGEFRAPADRLLTFEAILTTPDGVTRDEIVESVNNDDVHLHGLRFLSVSKAKPHEPRPSSFWRSPQSKILQQRDESLCGNSGVMLPNKTCVCDDFFSGQNCGRVNCGNGGVAAMGMCICPPGRPGAYCEQRSCTAATAETINVMERSIVVILSLKSSMARDLQQLIPVITERVRFLADTYPNIYKNFVLSTFLGVDGGTVDSFLGTPILDRFIAELENVAISKGNDKQPLIEALHYTLFSGFAINPRSTILMFADALPSDASDWSPTETNQTQEIILMENILAFGHRLVISLTDPPSSPIAPDDSSLSSITRLLATTHGDFIHTEKKQIATVASNLFLGLHLGENVFVKYGFSCGQTGAVIPTDFDMDEFRVFFSGSGNAVLTATDSKGVKTKITPDVAVKNFMIFSVPSSSPTISIDATGATSPFCSFRASVSSSNVFLLSFSEDARIDVGKATATQGIPHKLSFWSNTPTFSYTINAYDNTGITFDSGIVVQVRTDSCTFPLAGTMQQSCMAGAFYIKASATKQDGTAAYSRVIPSLCELPEQRSPPEFVCLNGGTLGTDGSGSFKCACVADQFTGDHCEKPTCHNGGSVNPFPTHGMDSSLCLCTYGFTGIHCESWIPCNTPSQDNFDYSNRVLSIVVQTSFSQAYILDQLTSSLNNLSTVYTQYQISTFNRVNVNGQATDKITNKMFTTAREVIDYLNEIKFQYASSDKQAGISAVDSALTELRTSNSIGGTIFLITDSDDESTDVSGISARTQLSQLNSPLYIIRTPQFYDGCGQQSQKNNSKYLPLTRLFGGVFIDVCENGYKIDDIATIITNVASHGPKTQFSNAYPLYEDDCSANAFDVRYSINAGSKDRARTLRLHFDSPNSATVNVLRRNDNVTLNATQTLNLPTLIEYLLPLPESPQELFKYEVDIKIKNKGGCGIYSLVDSDTTVFSGFTSDGLDYITNTPEYGTKYTPVVHVESGDKPATIAITVYNEDGKEETYHSTDFKTRDSCQYESIFPKIFSCAGQGKSFVVNTDVDDGQSPYSRSFFSFCQSLPPKRCVHGRFNDTSSSCVCDKGYSGDYCETPKCINQGNLTNGVCVCPPKYDGDLCQYSMCESFNFMEGEDPRTVDFRSVTFVMETTYNALVANTMFKSNLDVLLSTMDETMMRNLRYSLITYNDIDFNIVISTSAAYTFEQKFNATMDNNNYHTNTPNVTKAFEAIDAAMNLDVEGRHLIIAFVSSSSTPNMTARSSFIEKHPGIQVNIIYTPLSTGDPMLPGASPFYLYDSATLLSEGRVLPSGQSSVFELTNVFVSWLTEHSLIAVEGASNCTGGLTLSVPVESAARRLVIQIVGTGVDPTTTTITNSNTNTAIPLGPNLQFADNAASMIFHFESDKIDLSGVWTITTKTTKGRCLVQARTNSLVSTEIGFTVDEYDDFVKILPFTAKSNVPARLAVAVPSNYVLNGYVSIDSALLYETDFSTGKMTLKQTVDVNQRDPGISYPGIACAYQFVSNLFKFDTSYMAIKLVGTVAEQNGTQQFQRTFVVAPKVPLICVHGTNTVNGDCSCFDQYTGEVCQKAVCLNGGTSSGDICLCASGYRGEHCELYVNPILPTTTAAPTTTETPTETSPAVSSNSPASVASTTSAAPTSAPTTTPQTTLPLTTTTPPICYPDFTTYQIVFLLENEGISHLTVELGGTVAHILSSKYYALGSGKQSTFFVFGGVKDQLFIGNVTQKEEDIDDQIEQIEDSNGSTDKFNLGGAITSFESSEVYNEFTDLKPFAVIITSGASTDDATAAASSLRASNFTIISVATLPDALTSLQAISDYASQQSTAADIAEFIKNSTCKVKPREPIKESFDVPMHH